MTTTSGVRPSDSCSAASVDEAVETSTPSSSRSRRALMPCLTTGWSSTTRQCNWLTATDDMGGGGYSEPGTYSKTWGLKGDIKGCSPDAAGNGHPKLLCRRRREIPRGAMGERATVHDGGRERVIAIGDRHLGSTRQPAVGHADERPGEADAACGLLAVEAGAVPGGLRHLVNGDRPRGGSAPGTGGLRRSGRHHTAQLVLARVGRAPARGEVAAGIRRHRRDRQPRAGSLPRLHLDRLARRVGRGARDAQHLPEEHARARVESERRVERGAGARGGGRGAAVAVVGKCDGRERESHAEKRNHEPAYGDRCSQHLFRCSRRGELSGSRV